MKRIAWLSFAALAALVVTLSSLWAVAQAPSASSAAPRASAAPSASPSAAASLAPSASASAASSAEPNAELPPGHPPTDLPPGHPPTDEEPDEQKMTPDSVEMAEGLPPGTIDVLILDVNDAPVANVPISLSINFSSVSKGDSRARLEATTDDQGNARFADQKYESGISYRVNTANGPATFSSEKFGLTDQLGVRVILHRYEAVTSLTEAAVLLEAEIILDVKQDAITANHILRIYNLGKRAFVATDVRVPFPEGYEAFDAQDSMEGVSVVEQDGAMELRGTFPPGQASLSYSYNMPLKSGDQLDLKLPLPPRVAVTTVVLTAGKSTGLRVAGFPASEETRLNNGARARVTSRSVHSIEERDALLRITAPSTLDVTITGLPNPWAPRLVALILAAVAIAVGLAFAYQQRQRRGLAPDEREDLVRAKNALLAEIAHLEKLKKAGEVGPRSYASLHNQLLDALARIVTRLERDEPKAPRPDAPEAKRRKARMRARA